MAKHRAISRRRFLKYGIVGMAGLAGLNSLTNITRVLAQNPIPIENLQPGTTNWQITKYSTDANLEITGYAAATSVNIGSSLNFYVSVNVAQTYTIEIYRMGWYGGTGGRLLQSIGSLSGINQTVPTPDTLGTVACNWSLSYTLNVPATGWTTGAYLAKLTNANGFQNYIYFVVRDDSSNADLLFKCSVNTYQAYNYFGGKSLYPDDSVNKVGARKVSFDRPLNNYASTFFTSWEMPLLRFIEKNGYNVSYCTDIDLHSNATLLASHKALLSTGHDEYWSGAMYDNALASRNAGKHLLSLGLTPYIGKFGWRTTTG